MNLSGIRLVVTDMDGTLLNSKHELDPAFYDIFYKLRKKGIIFAAASGRQYHNIRNVFTTIKDDMYFIAENGGYVAYQEKDLHMQDMEPELAYSLLRELKSVEGVFSILCGKQKAYVEDVSPFFIEHLQRYYDEYETVNDLLSVTGDNFLKIAICDFSGSESNSYQLFRDRADLQIKVSGNIWLDISHKLANKGYALNKLQQHLNITPAETIVFGDYLNDLEMMQQAEYSFAMENAHDEVKAVAKYRARSNDEGGVIEVLRMMAE